MASLGHMPAQHAQPRRQQQLLRLHAESCTQSLRPGCGAPWQSHPCTPSVTKSMGILWARPSSLSMAVLERAVTAIMRAPFPDCSLVLRPPGAAGWCGQAKPGHGHLSIAVNDMLQ